MCTEMLCTRSWHSSLITQLNDAYAVPVDGEAFLYYVGYRWGHKYNHSTDRQVGLIKVKRDRYITCQCDALGGKPTTRLLVLRCDTLPLNAYAASSEVRVQISDAAGKPLPGLTFADWKPVTRDSLEAPVEWRGGSLAKVGDQPVQIQFEIESASFFAFELTN